MYINLGFLHNAFFFFLCKPQSKASPSILVYLEKNLRLQSKLVKH